MPSWMWLLFSSSLWNWDFPLGLCWLVSFPLAACKTSASSSYSKQHHHIQLTAPGQQGSTNWTSPPGIPHVINSVGVTQRLSSMSLCPGLTLHILIAGIGHNLQFQEQNSVVCPHNLLCLPHSFISFIVITLFKDHTHFPQT